MSTTRRIYSLSELGKSLRSVIERSYTSSYWIKAEIAKLNFYPRSGHCYPELVEKSGDVIQAQMRATIWATDYRNINREFEKIAGDTLKEGMSVLFRATIGYHPVYGLSLQIWEVEPAFTLGQMALQKKNNIELLKKQGVFYKNKALPMPLLPKRIAIISVETSKGYSDFLKILKQQAAAFSWWHYLFPSVLQGDKAAEGIMSQLRIIKKVKHRFDMVAIIRGGGGDIGLSCYDDYNLSCEIASFPLPVITGIGHATNETVAEMVAWSNKITPTDVAYFVMERFKDFKQRIDKASQSVHAKTKGYLSFQMQRIAYLKERTAKYPGQLIRLQQVRLGDVTDVLMKATAYLQNKKNDHLSFLANRIPSVTQKVLIKENYKLESNGSEIRTAANNLLMQQSAVLKNYDTTIQLLNPQNILKRGYSITTRRGRSITDAHKVAKGDQLVTKLYKGEIKSTVG